MFALSYFVNRTLTGLSIKAVALDRDAAALMGINPNIDDLIDLLYRRSYGQRCRSLDWHEVQREPVPWRAVRLKSFASRGRRGDRERSGAYLGGYLIGSSETLGSAYISSNYKDAIAFVPWCSCCCSSRQGF
jgi:branched-chain amino acid transport system permease protein